MEYSTYDALMDVVKEMKKINERLSALELKFFYFESKIVDVDDKLSKVIDITEGVSSSFGDMNITPDQVQNMLQSFGLSGQAPAFDGGELVDTLQSFRLKLGELSGKLSQISTETEKT
jgi:hypothetical protein